MVLLAFSLIFLISGVYIAFRKPFGPDFLGSKALPLILVVLSIVLFGSRSFVYVQSNKVGLLERIYFAENMAPGQIVAFKGQKGPQADVIPYGFHFIPFVRVLNKIEYADILSVPEGSYAMLVAKDGAPLNDNQFIAGAWKDGSEEDMINADYFLRNGGQRGPQYNVLKPAQYRLNPYLFDAKVLPALDVPTGTVAVVRSNVQTENRVCPITSLAKSEGNDDVARTVVPKGCIGVWETALSPGRYYLNDRAFVTTLIPTRLQNWNYAGGYVERKIDLTVGDDGIISQEISKSEGAIVIPTDAADAAINVRVEGWTIPVEMRVVVAVNPANAAKVVSSVGDLQKVEDNIITPAIRDILRTIGGTRKVHDFMYKRDEIVAEVERALIPEGRKAGVTIQEVRMGEPAIPPELLVATLREQLAVQLQETYKQEQTAQSERIKVETERETANQQGTLVASQIRERAAEFIKNEQKLLGEGEKLRLMEIAKGQQAQSDVLGQEGAIMLASLGMTLDAAKEVPEMVKVPLVNVSGGGAAGLEGAAAILGASNIFNAVQGTSMGKNFNIPALPPAVNK